MSNTARAEQLVGTTARLEFYDWEANALTPSGKPVASLLQAQDPNALLISQGSSSGAGAPGGPGAGSMSLHDAVVLAAKQAPEPANDNARAGPAYYLFGAPGSVACATAARDLKTTPTPGVNCLLSGPADNRLDLVSGIPAGVTAAQGKTLVVPQGIVVLQATPSNFSKPPALFEKFPRNDVFISSKDGL